MAQKPIDKKEQQLQESMFSTLAQMFAKGGAGRAAVSAIGKNAKTFGQGAVKTLGDVAKAPLSTGSGGVTKALINQGNYSGAGKYFLRHLTTKGQIVGGSSVAGLVGGSAWFGFGGNDEEAAGNVVKVVQAAGTGDLTVEEAVAAATGAVQEGAKTTPTEEGAVSKILGWVGGLIKSAADKAMEFSQKRDDAGNIIQGAAGGIDIARATGLALFAGLICLGIYKVIKWLGSDEDTERMEESVQELNYRFKILNNKMTESSNFINNITTNYLRENSGNYTQSIIQKAASVGPAVAKYSVIAEENKNRQDISMMRKLGYFLLGGLSAVASVLLYLNWSKIYIANAGK